jgi:hypothetical protein
VVVAVVAVRTVQPAFDEVVAMVSVWHRLMAAVRPVLVVGGMAARLLGAPLRVGLVDREAMLVDVVLVRVMQAAVVQVVDVPFVPDRHVAAVAAVLVIVARVDVMVAHARKLRPGGRRRPATAGEIH